MSADPLRRAWPLRRVPPELERRYVEEGWWTDETLGAMVARQLASNPASQVAIWSRSHPWRGSYANADAEASVATFALGDALQSAEVGRRAVDRANAAVADLETPALIRADLGLVE